MGLAQYTIEQHRRGWALLMASVCKDCHRYSPDDPRVPQARSLRDAKHSISDIGKKMKCSASTVSRLLRSSQADESA